MSPGNGGAYSGPMTITDASPDTAAPVDRFVGTPRFRIHYVEAGTTNLVAAITAPTMAIHGRDDRASV